MINACYARMSTSSIELKKSEARNPKYETIPKLKCQKGSTSMGVAGDLNFSHLNLFRISTLGFKVSMAQINILRNIGE